MNENSINPINELPAVYGNLWTIAENWSKHGISEIKNISTETSLFLDPVQIEGSIRGNDLYEFLKEKNTPVLNATIWEYLRNNESLIPEEWRFSTKGNAQYIFFWGTIDRSPDGNLYVRYITWSGGNWVFSNYLMSGNWHEDFPAVIKKSQP
jgi:predicted dithiol-disulfide oxidoreductase (DUF899 family)